MKDTTVKVEISIYTLLTSIGLILGLLLLWEIRYIFFMLFFAFIINSALRPLVDRLEERKIPRIASISLVYTVMMTVALIGMITIVTQTSQQFAVLIEQLPVIISNLVGLLADLIESVGGVLGVSEGGTESLRVQLTEFFSNIDLGDIGGVFSGGFGSVLEAINSALTFIIAITFVLVLSIYMLNRKEGVYAELLSVLPKDKSEKYARLLKRIEVQLGAWMRGQLFITLIIGVMTWVGLVIPSFFSDAYTLHDFALPIAFISALFALIPNIGPWISGVFAVVIAAGASITSPFIQVLYVMFLSVFIQQLEGTFITPKVMQKVVGLDPIITMTSVLSAFLLFGLIGAVLIIPLVAIAKIVIDFEREETKKLSA